MPFTLLDTVSSPLHRLQLISLALQQSTVEPPLARKLSEARSSPLRLEVDFQCWCWPGLPSFSKNSSQLDACSLLLHPNSSHALCQGRRAGSAGLPAASWGSTACAGGARGDKLRTTVPATQAMRLLFAVQS